MLLKQLENKNTIKFKDIEKKKQKKLNGNINGDFIKLVQKHAQPTTIVCCLFP